MGDGIVHGTGEDASGVLFGMVPCVVAAWIWVFGVLDTGFSATLHSFGLFFTCICAAQVTQHDRVIADILETVAEMKAFSDPGR